MTIKYLLDLYWYLKEAKGFNYSTQEMRLLVNNVLAIQNDKVTLAPDPESSVI